VAGLKQQGRARLPTARATSAGGIVVRASSTEPQILLGKRRRERDGVTWSLPKGTPNKGESLEQTALREVTEETGLEVEIVEAAGAIEYWFVLAGTRYHKTVHFYLMEPTGGELAAHDHEFDEVRWFPLGEAERAMSFESERRIVTESTAAITRLVAA
jgi:8-oxo-dGTP pyrophosphatase MutT (NUDIX family)